MPFTKAHTGGKDGQRVTLASRAGPGPTGLGNASQLGAREEKGLPPESARIRHKIDRAAMTGLSSDGAQS
jgi:hypothetical protein